VDGQLPKSTYSHPIPFALRPAASEEIQDRDYYYRETIQLYRERRALSLKYYASELQPKLTEVEQHELELLDAFSVFVHVHTHQYRLLLSVS
jgi:hypothetical protein